MLENITQTSLVISLVLVLVISLIGNPRDAIKYITLGAFCLSIFVFVFGTIALIWQH